MGLTGLLLLGGIAVPPESRVTVFIDSQNLFRGARRAFFDDERTVGSAQDGQFDPIALGHLLAARRTGGRDGRSLQQVRIYSGVPDAYLDPKGYAAKTRQCDGWEQRGAVVTRRPLQYPPRWPRNNDGRRPTEKGIDVALAVDLVRLGQSGSYDVAIVCSADTDLIPAIVDVLTNTNAIVEVAGWREGSYGQRIVIPDCDLFCHWLYRDNYEAVHDSTDYNLPSSRA